MRQRTLKNLTPIFTFSSVSGSRTWRVQLALRPGVEYSSRVPYYLVCRDAAGKVAWREEYRVEVAIAPVDDFGF